MCLNIQFLNTNVEHLKKQYKEIFPQKSLNFTINKTINSYYFVNGFSLPELPLISNDGIFLYNWGLIPYWVKDSQTANAIRNKTLNAVGETVFEKPSYKKCITNNRGILSVNGFFEWKDYKSKKYPYFIYPKYNSLFSLGCIYDSWFDKSTNETFNTFSIITTEANSLMKNIHNIKQRMPLILDDKETSKWLNNSLNTEEIKALIKPYSDDLMAAHTISQKVNNARFNRNFPDITNKIVYQELENA